MIAVRRELLGFATACLLAYAADLALFTCRRGPAGLGPLTAKALSFVAGCSVAYAGNTLGTYRHTPEGPEDVRRLPRGEHRRRPRPARVSHREPPPLSASLERGDPIGLGPTSQTADTVSGAGIGMALATVLRFWGTRTLVFRTFGT